MARKREGTSSPLSVIDMLRAGLAHKRGDDGWYPQHRAQVLAHLRGAPCDYGGDGRVVAARLVCELDRDADVVAEARQVLDEFLWQTRQEATRRNELADDEREHDD